MESAKRLARRLRLTRTNLRSLIGADPELTELRIATTQLHQAFVQAGGLPIPPPHLQARVAGAYYADFIRHGDDVLDNFEEILKPAGRTLSSFKNVLDFGCSVGRMLRAYHYRRVAGQKFYGTDIERGPIEWCAANYQDVGEFVVNDLEPPTKYPDAFFDFIYAVSVFTHITEESQFRWLAELKRIVKPGGLLILSFHGEHCRDHWPLFPGQLETLSAHGYLWTEPDRAYHTHEYIRKNWSRFFTVLELTERSVGDFQDSALLQA